MVECIVGKKGKGKTKHLLEKVRYALLNPKGSIVYIDKSSKHMFELDSKVRLIDVSEYGISNTYEFLGFLMGVLSQNRDVDKLFLDSFLDVSHSDHEGVTDILKRLDEVSEKFDVDFIISIGADIHELPENMHQYITVSL